MKQAAKWIVPVLIVLLVNAGGIMEPAHAVWPFKKKNENAEEVKQEDEGTSAESLSAEEQPATMGQPQAAATPPPPPPPKPQVQLKSPLTDEMNNLKVEDPVEDLKLPPEKTFVAVDDPANPLGITVSAQKLNESARLISNKNYQQASDMLHPLKEWLIDATEVHINLHKTLKGIPSAQVQAELEKQLALQFALLRDKAFFQLGMLAIAENDYNEAIKNLSKVIQSQPRSPMGAKAYDMLQKIGFTEKIQLKEGQ